MMDNQHQPFHPEQVNEQVEQLMRSQDLQTPETALVQELRTLYSENETILQRAWTRIQELPEFKSQPSKQEKPLSPRRHQQRAAMHILSASAEHPISSQAGSTQRFRRVIGISTTVAAVACLIIAWSLVPPLLRQRAHVQSLAQQSGSSASAPDPISFLHMNSLTSGWAITRNGEVFHTTSGGKIWQTVLTRPMLNLEQVFPESSHPGFFPNAETAWIVSATSDSGGPPSMTSLNIYHTADAGQHWQKIGLKHVDGCLGYAPDLTFSDSQHGWLLCHLSAGAGSEGKHLFRTQDGGHTWTRLDSLSVPVPGYETGLTFRDALTGWMTIFVGASGCLSWYITHDGGLTWNAQKVPTLCTKDVTPVTGYPGVFFDQQHGVIPVGIGDPSRGSPSSMYITSDGGQTWKQFPSVNALAQTADYSDAHHAWIISDDGKMIYASNDGGQHWQLRSKNPGGAAGFVTTPRTGMLDFVTTQIGWEIDDGALFQTIDGGENWAQQNYSFSS